MIVRTGEDIVGTKGEARGDKWRSLRFLHEEDGMGVTLVDGLLEPGFDMVLWQKNHLEACYCIEGEGTVEELESGRVPSSHSRHYPHVCHLHLRSAPDRQ